MNQVATIILALNLLVTTLAKAEKKSSTQKLNLPTYHFSTEKHPIIGLSGIVKTDSLFHLFFLQNENGEHTLAHIQSSDLIHWTNSKVPFTKDISAALDTAGHLLSGTIVPDHNNCLQLGKSDTKTLVFFYIIPDLGTCMAYSTDNGNTWTPYAQNPIIEAESSVASAHSPKVFFHAQSGKWLMTIHRQLSSNKKSNGISIYSSNDLKNWNFENHIAGFTSGATLTHLKVSNRINEKVWVLIGDDGNYLVGDFDGEKFTADSPLLNYHHISYLKDHQPKSALIQKDGKTIQICLLETIDPADSTRFGTLSIPCELNVNQFPDGYRLLRTPLSNLHALQKKKPFGLKNKNVIPGINDNKLKGVAGQSMRIWGEFDLKTCNNFGMLALKSSKSKGVEILYNTQQEVLRMLNYSVPLSSSHRGIELEIWIDRCTIEVFANQGLISISSVINPDPKADKLMLFTNGGELYIKNLEVAKITPVYTEK